MKLWELMLRLFALWSLPVETVTTRSTDVANMVVLSTPPFDQGHRLVRSIPSFSATDGRPEIRHDTPTETETVEPEGFLRSLRGRDSFIRFGRGKNDNFMRFGRGKQDNFMRFGRSNDIEIEPNKETDDFGRSMRSGKGNKKSESERFERLTKNFIRLGRGAQDNIVRFGRGNKDNFMRFGRGKQDNFMRFGRENKGDIVRFGRGKEDNYMRFGRDIENLDLLLHKAKLDVNDALRNTKGMYDSFGRHFVGNSDDNMSIFMHSLPAGNHNFDRFQRSRQDSFLRFGKPDSDQLSSAGMKYSEELKINPPLYIDSTFPLHETFTRVTKSKLNDGVNLLRQGRHPPNKDDSFIRFGRDTVGSLGSNLVLQRQKRSTVQLDEVQEDMLPSKLNEVIGDPILLPVYSLTDGPDEDQTYSDQLEGYNSRRKRQVNFKRPQSPLIENRMSHLDNVSSKLHVDSGKLHDLFTIPLFFTPSSSSISSEE